MFEPLLGVLNGTVRCRLKIPEAGEPARFGFTVIGNPVLVDVSVRSGEDYGVTVKADDITQTIEFLSSSTTVWGTPGAVSHGGPAGLSFLSAEWRVGEGCSEPQELNPQPFLVEPTVCPGPVRSVVEGDSWVQAGEQEARGVAPVLEPLASTGDARAGTAQTGCRQPVDQRQARWQRGVRPQRADGRRARAPGRERQRGRPDRELSAGYHGRLPEGVAVNPSGGDGLAACSEGLVGYQGERQLETIPNTSTKIFSAFLPGNANDKEAGEEAGFRTGV